MYGLFLDQGVQPGSSRPRKGLGVYHCTVTSKRPHEKREFFPQITVQIDRNGLRSTKYTEDVQFLFEKNS